MSENISSKITAKQVAERAGVSVAAVSRAFRDDAPLAADKRLLIRRVAAELGYRPPLLRAAQGQAAPVMIVASELANPFYPMAVEALTAALGQRGQRSAVIVAPRDGCPDTLLDQIAQAHPAAVVVLSSTIASSLSRRFRALGIAAILFNRVQIDAESTAVTCDNHGGARLVARRFVQQGRRRIGMLSGARNTSTQMERARGFRDGLAEAGQALFCEWHGDYDYGRSLEIALGRLSAGDLPDALFCANDIMALAVLDAARRLGLSVPGDLAVIGFDDIPNAAWQPYRLTTVAQPIAQMTAETMQLLRQQAEGRPLAGSMKVFPVELILRDSG